jgi:hypothetical protein
LQGPHHVAVKVDEDGDVRLQDFGLEVGVGELDHVLAGHGGLLLLCG